MNLNPFRISVLAALVFVTFVSPRLAAAADTPKPNLLFILSDDHSYPFVGCYGNPNVKTPNLDRFAAEGMKLHRMFTAAPQCVPSRAAIMTGRSPVAARITRFSSPLARDEVIFPELLRAKAGYYTGVCGRTYHLDGSGRQSEAVQRVFKEQKLRTFAERMDFVESGPDEAVPERVSAFLDAKPASKPFFLWVNFSDPHQPWNANADEPKPESLKLPPHWPDLPGVRQDLAAYIGEVNRLDRKFQAVLDVLAKRGLDKNTLIIFMGDNGAALPHGKGSLYDPGLNVPLLVRWPGMVQPGGESRELISGEDIGPTFLEAAGLPKGEKMSGVSFLKVVRGQPHEPRKYIFGERGPHGTTPVTREIKSAPYDLSRCVRSDRYKFIYNCTPWLPYSPVDTAGGPGWQQMIAADKEGKFPELHQTYFGQRPVYELYDLEADPSELKNRAGDPALAEMEKSLREALAEKMIVDFDYLPLPDTGPVPARRRR